MAIAITITVLLLLNALFVAAEFAIVGVRRHKIRQLASEGNGLAKIFLPFIEDHIKMDHYIAACEIGMTLTSIILGAYGQSQLESHLTPLFSHWGNLHEAAAISASIFTVLLILTIIKVILAELVPKSITLQYTTQVALFTVIPIRFFLMLFSWLIFILNRSSLLILNILGISFHSSRHIHSPEEIEMLLAESYEGGVLGPREHLRLHRALQLMTRTAEQLMVPRKYVSKIEVSTNRNEFLEIISKNPFTRIPVYEKQFDNVIGILHTKDVAVRFSNPDNPDKEFSIRELMRPALKIPASSKVDKILKLFREHQTHQAILLDEHGGFEGIITLEDILSEMMGNFSDELKKLKQLFERLPCGRVRISGLKRTIDMEKWIGADWKGDSKTVGGYVIEHLQRLPEPGEFVTIDGITIEIERVEKGMIASVVITPIETGVA